MPVKLSIIALCLFEILDYLYTHIRPISICAVFIIIIFTNYLYGIRVYIRIINDNIRPMTSLGGILVAISRSIIPMTKCHQ